MKLAVTRLGDDEAGTFADDIITALQESGWDITVNRIGMMTPPVYGLALNGPTGFAEHPCIKTLVHAFSAMSLGLEVRRTAFVPTIVVGLKPTPLGHQNPGTHK